jgi:hypothetical protein
VTLQNTFTPTAGQAGFRVLNTTATPYDVFVTALNAVLAAPPTVANATQGTASAFVSVPAGSEQIRVLGLNTLTPVVLDVGSQTITAGTNYTLVIAPPAQGQTVIRAFLVPGC